jgi:4-hydroxy-3-polyprenylbenzoate decarboxylase
MNGTQRPVVVGMTGASGAAYGRRLVEVLLECGTDVWLTISPAGAQVLEHELGTTVNLESLDAGQLWPASPGRRGELHYVHYQDYMAPVASGSFLTRGMVICPCSGASLAGAANGLSRNLVERAAEVHLKERRPLILVQRETPLSLPTIENMRRAVLAGATILPAMPAWYHGAHRLEDLVDFIVARILDQLGIGHSLVRRWGTPESAGDDDDREGSR